MKFAPSFSIAILLVGFACTPSAKLSQPAPQSSTLFSVNGKAVSTEEFQYVFNKNRYQIDTAITRQELQEYLDLFVRFKLKVTEAFELNLDQTDAFKSEFNNYAKQLAKPYLTENRVTEQLVQEAYERLKTEVNASHILIEITPEADPSDTLKAYYRIKELRDRALRGHDFAQLASQYSHDPSARELGGNLGYFSSMQMVYSFEDAAYKTNVNEVSPIIRTRYGYHIIKVHDKRPSRGKVKVSHIMVRATEGISAEDSINAHKKAREIFNNLQQGADWNTLCSQFSDDLNSRNRGGSLPIFGTGSMVSTFEEAAFALNNVGDISEPIKTDYGWHIIRLDEKQGLEPFDQMKSQLETKVSRDSRSEIQREAFLKRIKAENNFKETAAIKNKVLATVDSSLLKAQWMPPTGDWTQKPLFSIQQKTFSAHDFFTFIIKNQRAQQGKSPEHYMGLLYQRYVDEQLLHFEENQLETKYPEYRLLVNEYKEGILLFQLMEERVWVRAAEDTVGLHKYFEKNAHQYQWVQRFKGHIFNAANANIIAELAVKSTYTDQEAKELEKRYNVNSGLNLTVQSGVFEQGSLPILSQIQWKTGNQIINDDSRVVLIQIQELIPAGRKKIEEVKGLLISDYQNYLEQQWVEELKAKYPVQVNDVEWNKLIQRAK